MFMLASHRLPLFINFSVSRQLGSKNYGAVPWLRQLVAGLLLQTPRFKSQASLDGICGAQSSSIGTSISLSTLVSPVIVIRPVLHTDIHSSTNNSA